jgi:hypothetical protein
MSTQGVWLNTLQIMKVSLHDLLQVAPWTTTQRAIIHLAAELLDVSFDDLINIALLLRPVDAGVHSRGGLVALIFVQPTIIHRRSNRALMCCWQLLSQWSRIRLSSQTEEETPSTSST